MQKLDLSQNKPKTLESFPLRRPRRLLNITWKDKVKMKLQGRDMLEETVKKKDDVSLKATDEEEWKKWGAIYRMDLGQRSGVIMISYSIPINYQD